MEDFPSRPVIYAGDGDRQTAMASLGAEQRLREEHGSTVVDLSSSNTYSHGRKRATLREYLDSFARPAGAANETFYLFGHNYEGVFAQLSALYAVPPCEFCGRAGAVTVGLGGEASGVSFHFHGPGFSESVIGAKRWFLYPPHLTRVVERFGANLTVAEWAQIWYPALRELALSSSPQPLSHSQDTEPAVTVFPSFMTERFSAQELLSLSSELMECVIVPGEALYFPAQWIHGTLNLAPYNLFVSVFLDPQLAGKPKN